MNNTDARIISQNAGVADGEATVTGRGDLKEIRAAGTDRAGNVEGMVHVRGVEE